LARDPFEIKFLNFVRTERLIEKGDSILVACSGGADSTCLLHLLAKFRPSFGVRVAALYVNHGIRTRGEIFREKKLLKEQCEKLEVPLIIKKIDAKSIAKTTKKSLEEAAHEGRYGAIFSALEEGGFQKCATAHHLDDSAESTLMRIFKGGSPSSLSGIRPVLAGRVIRPLLFASRSEVESYLSRNEIAFSTDSTNCDERFERNFIRKKVVPLVKERFPGFLNKISTLQNIQRAENDFIDSAAVDFAGKCFIFEEGRSSFDAAEFRAAHQAIGRRAILYALRRLGFNPAEAGFGLLAEMIDFICDGPGEGIFEIFNRKLFLVKKTVYSAKDYCPEKTTVIMTPEKPADRGNKLPEEGLTIDVGESLAFKTGHFEFDFSLIKNDGERMKIGRIAKNSSLIAVPAEAEPPFIISAALPGDRIRLRDGNSQKLSDLFVNKKIPREIRREIPVVRDLNGEIVCVSNIKVSEYSSAAAKGGLKTMGYFLSIGVKSIL